MATIGLVERSELVDLIRDAVPAEGREWAELGAGAGAFTEALAVLVGPGAHIVAVDRDAGALRRLRDRLEGVPEVRVETMHADFTLPLDLEGLDGVLMANSLHFVRDKAPVVEAVRDMLRPGGTLVLVEYDADCGNHWVPHPLTFATWKGLAEECGFEDVRLVATRPSRHLGGMYSASARRA